MTKEKALSQLMDAVSVLREALVTKDRAAMQASITALFEAQDAYEASTPEVVPVKRLHHCTFLHCWDCHVWGVNLPGDSTCSNCGSAHTTEYTPNE